MKRLFLGLGCWLALTSCSAPAPHDADSVLRIRWSRDPENLDPLVLPNPNAVEATNLVYCSLLTVDYTTKKFVPWLVETMPLVRSSDSLTQVTYRLRPEASWDNGQPVLASDVVFTLKAMHCPGLPNEAAKAQYGFIESIQVDSTDPRRFTLRYRGNSPDLLQSSGDYPILPEYRLDPAKLLRQVTLAALRADSAQSSLQHNPAVTAFVRGYTAANLGQRPKNGGGCGAYQVTEWQPNRFLRLQRKPGWWGSKVRPQLPQLQAVPATIEYEVIPDDATALLALRRGDIDVFPMVPTPEFVRLRQSRTPGLAFYTADSYEMLAVGFNTRRPELHDALTRQALSALLDPAGLIRASQQGQAVPSVGLISPQSGPLYNDSLPLPRLDPIRARRLLGQAGWQQSAQGWTRTTARGRQLLQPTISYRAGNPALEAIALQLRAAAGQLGIKVQPRPTEASLFAKQLQAGETELFVQQLSGNPFVYNFTPILHSQSLGWGNFTGFGTRASDQLIERIATATNPAQQARLIRKLQRVLQQEAPLTVLYFLKYRVAADQNLTNLHVTGIRPGYEAATIGRRSQQ